MKPKRQFVALVAVVALAIAACSSGASPTPAPSAVPSAAPSTAPNGSPTAEPSATPIPGGLLDVVTKAGKIRVSMDANYAPQSSLKAGGDGYEGFDIDVATEIAKRMGLGVEFTPQKWEVITAGSWAGRWDMSVGSMTITADREKILDFSPPYYYTPAQMAASNASGITTLEGMAGKTVCVGKSTTYLTWLEGGKLDFGSLSPTTTPPPGVKVVTLETDADCAQQWAAGRNDFEGWLTAAPTVAEAIKQKQPLAAVGDPVYAEPLAAALDKSGPDTSDFLVKLKAAVEAMHEDGTLSAMSMKWYGIDLTTVPGQ